MNESHSSNAASATVKTFFGGIVGLWGVIIGLLIACIACVVVMMFFSSQGQKMMNEQNTTPTQEVKQSIYKIGDKIDIDGIQLTVLSIADNLNSLDTYMVPQDGNKLTAVEVEFVNNSDSSKSVSEYDFSLKDTNGYSHNSSLLEGKRPTLGSSTLAKGEKARGWLNFQPTKESNNYILEYNPSIWTGEEIKIELF